MHLIGHSLGAHVVGFIGKKVQEYGHMVPRITGLVLEYWHMVHRITSTVNWRKYMYRKLKGLVRYVNNFQGGYFI